MIPKVPLHILFMSLSMSPLQQSWFYALCYGWCRYRQICTDLGFLSHSWGQFRNTMHSPLIKCTLKWIHRLYRGLCKESIPLCMWKVIPLFSFDSSAPVQMSYALETPIIANFLLHLFYHWLLSSLLYFQPFLSHTYTVSSSHLGPPFQISFSLFQFLLSSSIICNPTFNTDSAKSKVLLSTYCFWKSEFSNAYQRITFPYQNNTFHIFLPYCYILDSHIIEWLNEYHKILCGQFNPPKSILWLYLLCLYPELTNL